MNMKATQNITEASSIQDFSKEDLIELLKNAVYLVNRLDEKLEDFAPEWYACADDIADSSDFSRNIGDWLLA